MIRLALLVAGAAAVPVQVDPSSYSPAANYRPVYESYSPVYDIEDRVLVEEEEQYEPQPYRYEYGVQDEYSQAAFTKSETQDEVGAVTGSYKVNLPDGRVQTVTYTADPVNGYKAVVSYEGEPVYPPEPEEGYGNQYKYRQQQQRPGPQRVYRESPLPSQPVPSQEYITREDGYLPEYVARVV